MKCVSDDDKGGAPVDTERCSDYLRGGMLLLVCLEVAETFFLTLKGVSWNDVAAGTLGSLVRGGAVSGIEYWVFGAV